MTFLTAGKTLDFFEREYNKIFFVFQPATSHKFLCHCEATLGIRDNPVKHEITTPHEMRLVMTNRSMLSLRGDPWEPWQSIFCIAFVGLVFRPASPAHLKVRTTNTNTCRGVIYLKRHRSRICSGSATEKEHNKKQFISLPVSAANTYVEDACDTANKVSRRKRTVSPIKTKALSSDP